MSLLNTNPTSLLSYLPTITDLASNRTFSSKITHPPAAINLPAMDTDTTKSLEIAIPTSTSTL